MNYHVIANSGALWISCIPIVLIVAIQAIIFSKKAMSSAHLVDLSIHDAKKAFKVGALSAIGPALGVFVVMLGLMAVIGAPLAWQRLAIIGAAPTELAAANMSAKAMNIEFTSPDYGLVHFSNAAWVMALNGSAWLFTTGMFSDKLEGITQKIAGGNPKKLGILMVSAMCGAFSYLFGKELIKGLDPKTVPFMVSGIAAAIAMIVLDKLAKKYPKMTEYNLGIAMIVGMATAVIYTKL
ncbi:MAG: DUF5058 family protein [Sedimentibacter sp.]